MYLYVLRTTPYTPHTPLVYNINSRIYFNSENEYNGNDEW